MEQPGTREAGRDSTATTEEPGTSSDKPIDLVWANEQDFTFNRKDILAVLKAYFKKSCDRTNTPEGTFKVFEDNFLKPFYYLVFYKEKDIPVGFLCGQLVQDRAEVLGAYLPQEMKKRRAKAVSDVALAQFESWARSKKAKSVVFYTFRDPGAHKEMIRRGFSFVTTYTKTL